MAAGMIRVLGTNLKSGSECNPTVPPATDTARTKQATCVTASNPHSAPRSPKSMTKTGITPHTVPCATPTTDARAPPDDDTARTAVIGAKTVVASTEVQ
jgi:hypothetical protein